jgi:hypothetical protein
VFEQQLGFYNLLQEAFEWGTNIIAIECLESSLIIIVFELSLNILEIRAFDNTLQYTILLPLLNLV